MDVWQFFRNRLERGEVVALLYVVYSEGSSPGRQGFRMGVGVDGKLVGSIGGGIMEHKLVELVKERLKKKIPFHELRQQIHRKDVPKNQSGMICAGEQTIVLTYLDKSQLPLVNAVIQTLEGKEKGRLSLQPDGLKYEQGRGASHFIYRYENEENWLFQEEIGFLPRVHIFGAGHVGLALSKVMAMLDFEVRLYDDRPDLNTFTANVFAHKKITVDYADVTAYIPETKDDYVVLMTFGYRSDELILRQLIDKKVAYLGMMGSKTKVGKMFESLFADGFTEEQLTNIYAPIGLPIHSKTPAEIAISIAGQLLLVRNG